ncbi:MAG: ATP-binding cassette domain-containing protein [Clostridium sp.]|jgi:ABC-2 type transport system ATP-binding protein|nr:ATP-binding cassette domain-containing protein [Clostridium sp.]
MSENALTANGLTKEYPDFLLNNVSFAVPQGKTVGFIGENGAGKSTTRNAVPGRRRKDAGGISVLDKREHEMDNAVRGKYLLAMMSNKRMDLQ